MSSRSLRRHSRSLVRARAPQKGPKPLSQGPDSNRNGPHDPHNRGDDNNDSGNGHGNGFGHEKGGGQDHGNPHDPQAGPDTPPTSDNGSPPAKGSEPTSGSGTAPAAGNVGGGPPSVVDGGPDAGGPSSEGNTGGNAGGNGGSTTGSGSNPPGDANGGSSRASSIPSSPPSSTSSDTPSKTSDSTTQSSSDSPVNTQISDTTASGPSVSANVVSPDSMAVSTAASLPSLNPSPSSTLEVTPEAALSHHTNGGAIAGGVVGGVLFAALAFGAWIVYKRRRRNRIAPSAEYLANPSAYPFARGFGATANRSEKSNPVGSNYGGAGTDAAGNANFRSMDSDSGPFSEINPQMEQYRDERPSAPPPQPEILYSTRPTGTPPPVVSTPGSMPGTPTTPNGRRIPFGTGTFQFPPRPPQPHQPIAPQPQ